MKDYLIIAEMFTEAHGSVRFVSQGNGAFAIGQDGKAIPRATWSASMQAVISRFPNGLFYWEKEAEDYRGRGYP